jgi:hypothetical protein
MKIDGGCHCGISHARQKPTRQTSRYATVLTVGLYRVWHFAPRLAAFAQVPQQLGWRIGSSLQID